MTGPWEIYDNLVLAKNVLGQAYRYAPAEELNDAIDKAFGLLNCNLPRLKDAIEDMEETDDDSS